MFCTATGAPLSNRSVVRAFKRTLARAGLRDLRFHDLRHSAASFALAHGVPFKVVQELLGHSTIAVTSGTYAHIVGEAKRDAVERVSAVIWPSNLSRGECRG